MPLSNRFNFAPLYWVCSVKCFLPTCNNIFKCLATRRWIWKRVFIFPLVRFSNISNCLFLSRRRYHTLLHTFPHWELNVKINSLLNYSSTSSNLTGDKLKFKDSAPSNATRHRTKCRNVLVTFKQERVLTLKVSRSLGAQRVARNLSAHFLRVSHDLMTKSPRGRGLVNPWCT